MMKKNQLLPKGIPLEEIIRQEEEWTPPEPVDAGPTEKKFDFVFGIAIVCLILCPFLHLFVHPMAAISAVTLSSLLSAAAAAVSFRIGRGGSSFRTAMILFGVLFSANIWVNIMIINYVTDPAAEERIRHVWLVILSVLYIPVLLFTVLRPFAVISAIEARSLRCKKSVYANYNCSSLVGMTAYNISRFNSIGASHYHYISDDSDYIAVLDSEPGALFQDGANAIFLIDPDYPEYFYDKSYFRELEKKSFIQLLHGIVMLIMAADMIIPLICLHQSVT